MKLAKNFNQKDNNLPVTDYNKVAFYHALMEVENGIRLGWDREKELWFPHESFEGGNPTIAYGHKLTDLEFKENFFGRGITEKQATQLMIDDFEHHFYQAEREFKVFYAAETYAALPEAYKMLLGEIRFNVGSLFRRDGKFGWPKLAQAMINKDNDGVRKEGMRFATSADGDKIPLTSRVNKIYTALGI